MVTEQAPAWAARARRGLGNVAFPQRTIPDGNAARTGPPSRPIKFVLKSDRAHGAPLAPGLSIMLQAKNRLHRAAALSGLLVPVVGSALLAGCTTVYHSPRPGSGYVGPSAAPEPTWTTTLGSPGARATSQRSASGATEARYAPSSSGIESRRDRSLGVRTSADALQRGMWSNTGPDLTYWRSIRLPTRPEDVIIFERGRHRGGYRSNWDWGY